MAEITDSVKKDLQQFVGDKFNIDTIISIYNISCDRMKALYKDKPNDWHQLTLSSLETRFKKSALGAKEVELEGYIIGFSDSFDSGKMKYDIAKALFDKDPQKAITDEVTDDKGVPLDESGFNKGKPMKEHNYVTNYIGMCAVDGKNPKVFELAVWSETVSEEEPKLHIKTKFNAVIKETKDDKYILSSNKIADFEYDESLNIPKFDKVKNIFDKVYLVPMDDIAKFDGKKTEVCMVQGVVLNIVKNDRAYLIKISDFISEKIAVLNIWMPKTSDISIGEGSTIKILGSITSKIDENSKETDYFMNFKGYIPVDIISPSEDTSTEKSDFDTVEKKDDKTDEEKLPDSVVASDVDKMENDIEL